MPRFAKPDPRKAARLQRRIDMQNITKAREEKARVDSLEERVTKIEDEKNV